MSQNSGAFNINMPEYLEVSPSLPGIKTTKDLLQSVHDKDEIYKKYYQIGVAVLILIVLVVMGLVLLFVKNGKDNIKTVLHIKGMSISLAIVATLVFVLPWANSLLIHRLAISKWKSKNKLS